MSSGATAVPALVPDGYVRERERGAMIVALPSVIGTVRQAVTAAGTLYDWAAGRPGVRSFTGRGAAWGIATEHGAWVVRHYRRGGAVARVLHDRYVRLGEARPLRELRASTAARARGVRTPQVVAAVVYPAGPMYRADIATRYIEDSADLAEAGLPAGQEGATEDATDATAPRRAAAWRAAGGLLRAVFAAGVEHRDLNLRNILIQWRGHAASAFLLDLDRAVVHDVAVSDAVRSAMLERLHRSRRKLEAASGVRASAADLAALEQGLRHG